MTPQERQLVADLFDRLASLEGERRDPDAERLIRDGLGRAPNAVYALVQSVLIQDEALKRANDRIEELERAGSAAEPAPSGGFLDNMRNVLMGQPRGSVPSVRPGGQGSSGVWGNRPDASQPAAPAGYPQQPGYPQAGYPPAGYPQGGYPQQSGMMGGGGSFLGTAAAGAAGVIGGAMLLNGIRSMMGGHQAFAGDYQRISSPVDAPSHGASPWDSSGSGDLSRDAGVNDIGGHRSAALDDPGSRGSNFFGGSDDPPGDDGGNDDVADYGDDGGSDSDSA
jgi:hypothetical protein